MQRIHRVAYCENRTPLVRGAGRGPWARYRCLLVQGLI